MGWLNPRTWVSGETVTAALLNAHVRDQFKAIGDPWTAYTPTLGGITLGNGTLDGAFMRAGSLVIGRVRFVAGSSTTYTAANLSLTLPAAFAGLNTSVDVLGVGNVVSNNSAAGRFIAELMPSTASGSTALMVYQGGVVTNAAPFTWGTASRFGFTFTYEAA